MKSKWLLIILLKVNFAFAAPSIEEQVAALQSQVQTLTQNLNVLNRKYENLATANNQMALEVWNIMKMKTPQNNSGAGSQAAGSQQH